MRLLKRPSLLPGGLPLQAAGFLTVGLGLLVVGCGDDSCKPEPGADLTGCDLTGEDLAGAGLEGVVLDGAILDRADLRNADLTAASVRSASLAATDLRDADLTNTIFDGAQFADADLSGSDLSGASFHSVSMSSTRMRDSDLTDAIFDRAQLTDVDLGRARLTGVSFVGGDLAGTNLTGLDLKGSDLRRADLSNALLDGASLQSANLEGANFEGADLSAADLTAASLIKASLTGAELDSALLDQADLTAVVGLDQGQLLDALGVDESLLAEALFTHGVRLESHNTLASVADAVCAGQAAPGAAAYSEASTVHPLLVFDTTKSGVAGLQEGYEQWQPKSVRALQLVACLEPAVTEEVQQCGYVPDPSALIPGQPPFTVRRYQEMQTVRLVAAATGQELARETLDGRPPAACPQLASDGTPNEIYGGHVEPKLWLLPLVDPLGSTVGPVTVRWFAYRFTGPSNIDLYSNEGVNLFLNSAAVDDPTLYELESVLEDERGWQQAGIDFVRGQTAPAHPESSEIDIFIFTASSRNFPCPGTDAENATVIGCAAYQIRTNNHCFVILLDSDRSQRSITHEVGHCLGLVHGPGIMSELIDTSTAWPTTDDIAAAQRLVDPYRTVE